MQGAPTTSNPSPTPAPESAARATRIQSAGASEAGRVRSVNQDVFWTGELGELGTLALVADGMGGHEGGEVASLEALEAFTRSLRDLPPRRRQQLPLALARAAQEAHLEVRARASEHGAATGMGTTLTTLLIDDQVGLIGHVGDSRAYRWRQGELQQLTFDHSWVADRVRQGVLSAEEARRHRWRNVITNALGVDETFRLELRCFEVRSGDRFLLCSDGISAVVSERFIAQTLGMLPPAKATAALIAEANLRGSPDNITAVVVEVESLQARPKPYELPPRLSGDLGSDPTVAAEGVEAQVWFDITPSRSSLRPIDERFPRRSRWRTLQRHPYYPYRWWMFGSASMALLFLLFLVQRFSS
jgi:serine/threonine protein phosphatase PrpC